MYEQILFWPGFSVVSETPPSEVVYCVNIVFTMNRSAKGVHVFWFLFFFFFSGKTSHHRVNFIRIKLLLPFDFQLSLHPTSSVVFWGP